MFSTRLLLCVLTCAQAQVVIERFAGAGYAGGQPAWELGLHTPGTAWDTAGNAYFGAYERIWKLRPDGVVEAIAGTGEKGYGGDGGPALAAKLNDPQSVRRDAAGNLYFQDSNFTRIRRVDTQGVIKTVAGVGIPWTYWMDVEGPVESTAIKAGRYAVDPQGVIYISDINWMVRRVGLDGKVTVHAGNGPFCEYVYCWGFDVNSPVGENPRFRSIVDFAVHPSTGELYVLEGAASGEPYVLHRVSSSRTITRVRDVTNRTIRMAVDKDGGIFVVRNESPAFAVDRLDGGTISTPSVNYGRGSYYLFQDADGRVVYLDGLAVKSAADGNVVHSYPDGKYHPSDDGTSAMQSKLSAVEELAVSRSGEVFFYEPSNCSIRKFDTGGNLRSVFTLPACDPFPVQMGLTFGPNGVLYAHGGGRTYASKPNAEGPFAEFKLPEDLGNPGIIALDASGRIYGTNGDRVVRWEPASATVRMLGPQNTSFGTDAQGNFYLGNADGIFRAADDGWGPMVSTIPATSGTFMLDRAGHVWQGLSVRDGFAPNALLTRTRSYGSSPYSLSTSRWGPNGDFYAATGTSIMKVTGIGQRAKPTISAAGIVNGASYQGGAVAPGELISIFGSNFGVDRLQVFQTVNNRVPTTLGPVKVMFDYYEGAITAVTPTQINVFVPALAVGVRPDVEIVVQVDDAFSESVKIPLITTLFGLSTLDMSGKGQGAILNANGSVNSRGNPAAKGSIIVLFGTGEGEVYPDAVNGAVNVTTPYPKTRKPLSVRIGGQTAEILYSGGAPTLAKGVYQINARIPASTPSGDITVEVVAESGATSKPVTVAVQ